jgi:transposase-like protein
MDPSRQVPEAIVAKSEAASTIQRQRRCIAGKRRIVEETLVECASVARIAGAHGVNANQLFGWRRLYTSGRLREQRPTMKLLPVRVSESLLPARPLPLSQVRLRSRLRTQSQFRARFTSNYALSPVKPRRRSRRATERPRRGACGLTFATIALRATVLRRRCGLLTRPTAKASIHSGTSGSFAGPCRRMPTRVSISSTKITALSMLPAGRTCGATSRNRRTVRRWHGRHCSGSARCMESKNRFAVDRRTHAEPSARHRRSHCWILCDSGWRRPCRSSHTSRRRRGPSATLCPVGTR